MSLHLLFYEADDDRDQVRASNFKRLNFADRECKVCKIDGFNLVASFLIERAGWQAVAGGPVDCRGHKLLRLVIRA